MVQSLHPGVGSQKLQTLTVTLPEELDPGHQDGAVRPVLGSLSRHRGQHDHLRCSDILQIINLETENKMKDAQPVLVVFSRHLLIVSVPFLILFMLQMLNRTIGDYGTGRALILTFP